MSVAANVTTAIPDTQAPFTTILIILIPLMLVAVFICVGYWFYRTRSVKRDKNGMIPLVSPGEVVVEGQRQPVQHRSIQLLEVNILFYCNSICAVLVDINTMRSIKRPFSLTIVGGCEFVAHGAPS